MAIQGLLVHALLTPFLWRKAKTLCCSYPTTVFQCL